MGRARQIRPTLSYQKCGACRFVLAPCYTLVYNIGMSNTVRIEQVVPESALADIHARVAKLNRKAVKLGFAEFLFTVTCWVRTALDSRTDMPRHEMVATVVLEGETPRIAGWAFRATLDYELGADRLLIRALPGVAVPEEFRAVQPGRCDHCNQLRRRSKTYLLENLETGAYMVVGKQCLVDFIGHDPAKVIRLVDDLGSLAEEDFGGYGRTPLWDPATVLAYACAVTRADGGYISRAVAEDRNIQSTAGTVSLEIDPPKTYQSDLEITDQDREKARRILWWAGEELLGKAQNDYEHNLLAALSGPMGYRALGMAVSAVAAYEKAIGFKRARQAAALSQWVGDVGERTSRILTVIATKLVPTDWGGSTLVRMLDSAGNVLVWWASRCPSTVGTGAVLEAKFTVKKHDEYKGAKQTVVTRLTVLDVVEDAA